LQDEAWKVLSQHEFVEAIAAARFLRSWTSSTYRFPVKEKASKIFSTLLSLFYSTLAERNNIDQEEEEDRKIFLQEVSLLLLVFLEWETVDKDLFCQVHVFKQTLQDNLDEVFESSEDLTFLNDRLTELHFQFQ
jgi:hypothetical protein